MADTSQQELSEPHTNGAVDGLTEEEKSKMRPADIDADMREMERRKRVEMMMNSRLFREELERIIETQMKDGGAGPSGLLQQISDMMGAQGARFNSNVFKSSNCVVPINDIRGVESMGYAKGEKLLRCKLAAVFRLLDLYGWTQGVGGHITARLNQDQEHFLVNPYGLLYHEVTASSLVKVDMQGSVVEQGTTNFGVHITGFQLHSTIHAARPDIKCIIHITTPSVIAVSSLKCGLLPLGQESIVIGEVSTHQYIGGVFELEEKEKISRNLGPVNKIMFLTNRGALCCGETVEEAFYNVYNTVLACETQLKLIPVGIDNLTLVSEESRKAIFEASRKPPVPHHASVAEPSPLADKLEKRWRIGGTEFEALMRMLDNAGFRTGYIYRHPLIKGEPPRPRNDVEVPPAVSSLGYLLEEEELYKQGLWKGGRKGTDRSRWLNSPNVYQKVEILETGTPDPKKITKWVDQNAEEWVTDGSPTHSSTPVKIESALQFVPKNTNPKEFKQLQQQIKDYRRADKISAGPQSHILEGVTWDEAKKMQDATISATGEQVVLVGAASKGIIQRGFQHNAMVYKTPYAKNPFDAITDQELDQYKKDVERKQKGDPYDESQSESEALSSFNVSRATHESSTAKSPIQSPVSVTSETEEESRDEPRVLRIETKQVPAPSQPEVVLSDEPTAATVVADSPLVQQAQIQQVEQQSLSIIQQKPPVDATTEFLNEMRRSAVSEPRNDLNRRDCQSSNCSSISSGHSYGWPTEPYDTIQLEVARSTTVAPRMTPLITEIVHSTKTKTAELERTNIRIKQPPLVPPKPKPYLALRRAFFNNYSPTATPTLVTDKIVTPDNENEVVSLSYTLKKTQSAKICELLNVSTEQSLPLDFSMQVKNREAREQNMSNTDSVPNSGGNAKEIVNLSCSAAIPETGSNTSVNVVVRNLSLRGRAETNSVECVRIATDILEETTSVAGDSNDCETVFRQTRDESHKPLIVGAILKNINDLHTLCKGTDGEHSEKPDSKYKESLTKHSKNQDLVSQSDENGNLCAVSDEHLDNNHEIVGHGPFVDYNSNLFEVNTGVAVNQQNIDCVGSVLLTSEASNQELLSSQDKSASFREENALRQNPENSFSEPEDLSRFRDGTTKLSPLIIRKSNASTPPRFSNYCRMDSLTELVNSVKTDLTPTKMLLAMLPESNISSKYNLDSTSMSLIYSLTPTNATDTDAEFVETKHEPVDLLDGSFDGTKIQRLDSCNTDDSACDNESDYFWVDLLNEAKKDDKCCDLNQTIELSDNSSESSDECDDISNQGSDILELPYSTVCELRETDGESFNHDMKTVANQIIAELGDIEIYTQASNVIDEILYDISCLKLDANLNKNIVSAVVQDKLQALSIAKNMANTLIANLPCYGDREEVDFCEQNDNDSIIIIDEIVHHVIDVFESTNSFSNSSLNSYDLKKVKESTNTELKEMQHNIKYQTEESNNDLSSQTDEDIVFFKESTPISTTCDKNEWNVVEKFSSVNGVETVDPTDLETEKDQSFRGVCSSSNESFTGRKNEDMVDVSDYHKSNEDERLFITLESFTLSNYGTNLTSDVNKSVTDTDNNKLELMKLEGTIDEGLCCGYKSCPSPLDCDECSFLRFKQYRPIDDQNHSNYCDTSADGASLLENTDSDITDNDTLGEAILEFCSVPKHSRATEEILLNFSIERHETREDTVSFSNTCYRSHDNALDFTLPEQLAPIFEEVNNEALENSFNREVTIKTEKQVDCVDYFLDSEMAIAELFNEYANTSSVNKTLMTSPNPSVVSLESANTLDYYSCRDDSHSTMFQSLQNTTESSPNLEKNSNMSLEMQCETEKIGENLDRTYTLSDSSTNSLDTISSIESDEHKCSGKFIDLTYSADISTNMDETRLRVSMNRNSSSSSSEALLLNENHYFDTTTNMADVSSEALSIKLLETGHVDEDKLDANKGEDQNCVETLPQDCMVYSYDTREFMLLEEALDVNHETMLEMQVHCTCVSKDCEKFCTGIDADVDVSAPLDLPPRYEDTTLYKVVSQINLTDILNSVPDSPKH